MANSKQAKKRATQAEAHRIRRRWQVSRVNTFIKKVLQAVESKDKTEANTALALAIPAIDKLVTKGIIHKNKAARQKSRLNTHVKDLAV